MDIKKIEYAYFLIYENQSLRIEPSKVDSDPKGKKVIKRIDIPKDAEGLYIKALNQGISPVREQLLISGAVSKTVKVESSPFLDIAFEDRYVGSLNLIVSEVGEIYLHSKVIKGRIQVDMGSKLVIEGDIKKTEITLKRTSSLVIKKPIIDSIISGDVASIIIDVPGQEFYTYSSIWNIKTYKCEFKVKQPNEGARIYSCSFYIEASNVFLPYYMAFADTNGKLDFSLLSSVTKKTKLYVQNGITLAGALESPLAPIEIIQEDFIVLWKDIFPGQVELLSAVLGEQAIYKGDLYLALIKNSSSHYLIMVDMLGFYGIDARGYISFDPRLLRSVFTRIQGISDFPQEEMPIGNYVDSSGKVGISFSVMAYSVPFTFAGTVMDPDDYVIVKMFVQRRIYTVIISKKRFLTLMKGWNNILKEV